jgi:hypothetical protein
MHGGGFFFLAAAHTQNTQDGIEALNKVVVLQVRRN